MNTNLSADYAARYRACTILPGREAQVKATAQLIAANRKRYENVKAALVAPIPWWAIGVLHAMECDCNFNQHLHNGDPLAARTVQVPRNRPVGGKPPFTWEESALDALEYDKLDQVQDWSVGNALVTFENYNGTGYRKRNVPSPYLWSFTDQYRSGKYVRDGIYDPNAVSKQAGCAALMKALNIT